MPTQQYRITPETSLVYPELAQAMGLNGNNKEVRIPGTTTVIGRFKESGGLIYWAWDQGQQGLDYRQTRDAAADAIHSDLPHPAATTTIRSKLRNRLLKLT